MSIIVGVYICPGQAVEDLKSQIESFLSEHCPSSATYELDPIGSFGIQDGRVYASVEFKSVDPSPDNTTSGADTAVYLFRAHFEGKLRHDVDITRFFPGAK